MSITIRARYMSTPAVRPVRIFQPVLSVLPILSDLYLLLCIFFAEFTFCCTAMEDEHWEGQQRWHLRSMGIGPALKDASGARRTRAITMIAPGNCVWRALIAYWRRRKQNVRVCLKGKLEPIEQLLRLYSQARPVRRSSIECRPDRLLASPRSTQA
jgi:hypothetical protein